MRVMGQARGFAALVAPWVAMPGDRRMSPLVAIIIAVLLALGLAASGWLAIEGVHAVVSRLGREDAR